MGRLDLHQRSLSYVNDQWRVITGVELPLPIPFDARTASIHPDDRGAVRARFEQAVADLGPDPEDSAIVATIVNLAAILDVEAVAEGVETIEQLERLRELGCAAAQGFLFARPVPAAGLVPLLRRRFAV